LAVEFNYNELENWHVFRCTWRCAASYIICRWQHRNN